jgi:hypothetical protein
MKKYLECFLKEEKKFFNFYQMITMKTVKTNSVNLFIHKRFFFLFHETLRLWLVQRIVHKLNCKQSTNATTYIIFLVELFGDKKFIPRNNRRSLSLYQGHLRRTIFFESGLRVRWDNSITWDENFFDAILRDGTDFKKRSSHRMG